MVVDLGRSGLRARERAVLSPKTPAPTMRMLEGGGPFSLRGEGGFAVVLKGDGEGLQERRLDGTEGRANVWKQTQEKECRGAGAGEGKWSVGRGRRGREEEARG